MSLLKEEPNYSKSVTWNSILLLNSQAYCIDLECHSVLPCTSCHMVTASKCSLFGTSALQWSSSLLAANIYTSDIMTAEFAAVAFNNVNSYISLPSIQLSESLCTLIESIGQICSPFMHIEIFLRLLSAWKIPAMKKYSLNKHEIALVICNAK